jgi:hypothetical protein
VQGLYTVRKRPLLIRLLTLGFLLAPLGMLLEMAWLYKIPLAEWYAVFTPGIWLPRVLVLTLLAPVVGLCIWTVKRWAYPVLVVYTLLVIISDLEFWFTAQSLTGWLERGVLMAGIVCLIVLGTRRSFLAPYFNPRLRFWEQSQRFATSSLKIFVKRFGTSEVLFEAISFDVSLSGVYVVSPYLVAVGDIYTLDLVLPSGLMMPASGKVVWVNLGRDVYPQGFGCEFTSVRKDFRQMLTEAFKTLKVEARHNRDHSR